jgi:hypothetical protein
MDGPPRKRSWIPRIERSFEWSRVEAELWVLVYERIQPFARRSIARATPSNESKPSVIAMPNEAMGA